MNISTLASGIFEDLGQPDDINIGYVSGWLTTNVGRLNNLISTSFSGADGDITPELTQETSDIFKLIFLDAYYTRCAAKNSRAAAVDTVIEIEDDGSKIRKTSKNETTKAFVQLIKENKQMLQNLVQNYLIDQTPPIQATDPFYQVTTVTAPILDERMDKTIWPSPV